MIGKRLVSGSYINTYRVQLVQITVKQYGSNLNNVIGLRIASLSFAGGIYLQIEQEKFHIRIDGGANSSNSGGGNMLSKRCESFCD